MKPRPLFPQAEHLIISLPPLAGIRLVLPGGCRFCRCFQVGLDSSNGGPQLGVGSLALIAVSAGELQTPCGYERADGPWEPGFDPRLGTMGTERNKTR